MEAVDVAYTPDWEPLADALKRVMMSGVGEDQAKADLCRAVSDRKIDVRVRIAATDYVMGGRVFSDGNVGVPPHLKPEDLNWAQSRPFVQWSIGPKLGEHYFWIGGWDKRPLDLIEVSTRDVMSILCNANHRHSGRQRSSRGKSRPAIERAQLAIQRLYPDGLPDSITEPNKSLCRRVSEKLKESNLPKVSDDTILRAAERRK
jgi:hypothetical protein